MTVTLGGNDLEFCFVHILVDIQKCAIQGATSEVEDEARLASIVSLLKTVGNCCSSRFVDDAEHVEVSNLTSLLGGFTLTIIEVCRHCDYSISNG